MKEVLAENSTSFTEEHVAAPVCSHLTTGSAHVQKHAALSTATVSDGTFHCLVAAAEPVVRDEVFIPCSDVLAVKSSSSKVTSDTSLFIIQRLYLGS